MAVLDPQYLDAIKGFEGYSATPAWDYKQNSSGYGTVAQPGDTNIPIDQLKAIHEQRYQAAIAKAADHVDNVNPDLPPGARAALVSLTYNAGPGWANSGLGDLVRSGDLQGAQAKLQEYNKAGGEVNPGLVARRAKEAAWFGNGTPASPLASAIMGQPKAPQTTLASLLMGQPQTAPQPTQTPQEAATEQPNGFAQMQAPPMAPITAPPQRHIDLSKLKAALALGNRGLFLGRG